MSVEQPIVESVQRWFQSILKDGRFTRSKVQNTVAEFVEGLSEPTTLQECKQSASRLHAWLQEQIKADPTNYVMLKLDKRCGELLRTLNGALSRRGYQIKAA